MAHEIDTTNGRSNMAYAGAEPWHGLGQELTYDAPLETWKQEAGMDWSAEESPLSYSAGGEILTFPDRRVLYRSDSKAALSVVSGNYKVVHPGEALEFFRDLVDAHGFQLETAGCLFGGRKYWALAKVSEGFRLMGEDVVKPYLLLATSCDGSMATVADLTTVRVVCNNTLRMSIGANGANAKVKVPHHASFDPAAVKRQLGMIGGAWDNFVADVTRLSGFKIDRDLAIQIVADELKADWRKNDGEPMNDQEKFDSSTVLRRIIKLYDGQALGAEFKSSRGTAWGLVNAVTQYFDHEAGTKKALDRSRAFERAHLTDRAAFKANVANRLLELV